MGEKKLKCWKVTLVIFFLISALERRYYLLFPKHFHHFSSSLLCLRLVVYSNQAVVMSQLSLYWYAFLLCPGQFSSSDDLIWLFNYVKFRWLLLFRAEFSDAQNYIEFAAVHPARNVERKRAYTHFEERTFVVIAHTYLLPHWHVLKCKSSFINIDLCESPFECKRKAVLYM